MNAVQVYALLNKKIKNAASGIQSITFENESLVFTTSDGQAITVPIPNMHSHDNKDILDSITAEKIEQWDKGGQAQEIQLQVANGYIQWKYKNDVEWKNLIALDDLKGLDGADGKSAYEIAVENGFVGTEQEWLNSLKGADGQQGIQGQAGKDGVTPNIQIGEVTTLEAGQQATVTRHGDDANPIFDFGIPRGADGSGGSGGEIPDKSVTVSKLGDELLSLLTFVDRDEEWIPSENNPITIVGNNVESENSNLLKPLNQWTKLGSVATTDEDSLTIPSSQQWTQGIECYINMNSEVEHVLSLTNQQNAMVTITPYIDDVIDQSKLHGQWSGSTRENYTFKLLSPANRCKIQIINAQLGVEYNVSNVSLVKKLENIDVVSVALNYEEVSINKCESLNLVYNISPDNATNKNVTWTCSDKNIVSIDSAGKVTGLENGIVKITVSTQQGSKTANCLIKVVDPSIEHKEGNYYTDANKVFYNSKPLTEYIYSIGNVWFDKIYNALGDSITMSNKHTTKNYHGFVRDYLGLKVVNNYGIDGTTITKENDEDNTAMCVRYNEMSDSADLITVAGGVNDMGLNRTLGDINSIDQKTFYGALKSLCAGLITKYPDKTIVFITPTQIGSNTFFSEPNAQGKYIIDYVNAIKQVCEMYSIPVFDNYNLSGIYPKINKNEWTTDGLHWNLDGHEKVGRRLSNFIRQL